MKTSHYTTPRSMEQCQFAHDADPMDYGKRTMHHHDRIVLLGCVLAVVALIALMVRYG